MSDAAPIVELPAVGADRIAAAVLEVLNGDAEAAATARVGAEQSVAAQPTDPDAARKFQAMVELCWLVASADGIAPSERSLMAKLLGLFAERKVSENLLEHHFTEMEAMLEMMGRRERVARAAAEITDLAGDGRAVLSVAALVAMADGRLEGVEHEVLVEFGGYLNLDAAQVRDLVDGLARDVEARLR